MSATILLPSGRRILGAEFGFIIIYDKFIRQNIESKPILINLLLNDSAPQAAR